jgi:sialidase-1
MRSLSLVVLFVLCGTVAKGAEPVVKIPLLRHSDEAPRRSEGDFVQLRDGRLLFIYTKFTERGTDGAAAHLASRESRDGGRTWTAEDVDLDLNDGASNIMSVSLNRMADGRIALFYCRKSAEKVCAPMVRFSQDEAATWSAAAPVTPDDPRGCYVLNNDRVIQLRSGRLVAPMAQHLYHDDGKFEHRGILVCYLSDDGGKTWRRGKGSQDGTMWDKARIALQEPGVVERKDGSLLMFARTYVGAQFFCVSRDAGETWSMPLASSLNSPLGPASIERIPSTGDLLCVWNDHSDMPYDSKLKDDRTPQRVAISKDDGQTWQPARTLDDDPLGWYCYTAVEFVGSEVVLAYCASDLRTSRRLADTQITRFPVSWLYTEK